MILNNKSQSGKTPSPQLPGNAFRPQPTSETHCQRQTKSDNLHLYIDRKMKSRITGSC